MDLTSITPEPEDLKALAHPVRLRILGLLRSDGPATATSLAERLGMNSGATSYHLRQLHQHGFITDDVQLGNGRDRWWRAVHQATRADPADDSIPARQARDAFTQAVAVVHTETLQRAVEEAGELPGPWRRTMTTSDWELRLTPARARQLLSALVELVAGWEEDGEGAHGVGRYVVQLHTFPRPGTLAPDDGGTNR